MATPASPHDPAASAAAPPPGEIVARASTEYRVKRYIMVAILVGCGAWFGYDGFVAWPRENQRIDDLRAKARNTTDEEANKRIAAEIGTLKERTETDLRFQRVLCFALPPLGLAVLAWALYNSRGRYRLRDDVLHVPGHPPVPLAAITAIDKTDWDRKGIAYLDYELPNGTKGTLRLDDFIYQRTPTDDIYHRVEQLTRTDDAEAPPSDARE